jgi:hypothetical protein
VLVREQAHLWAVRHGGFQPVGVNHPPSGGTAPGPAQIRTSWRAFSSPIFTSCIPFQTPRSPFCAGNWPCHSPSLRPLARQPNSRFASRAARKDRRAPYLNSSRTASPSESSRTEIESFSPYFFKEALFVENFCGGPHVSALVYRVWRKSLPK